jgi:hypothetical protein
MTIDNLLISMSVPLKTEEFKTTKMPPDAQTKGEKAKVSKRFGQKDLMNL